MLIVTNNLTYKYSPNTVFETTAISDISIKIDEGEFIGLIGKTGSGKSTFIQHLNGLLKATSGELYYKTEDIYHKDFDIRRLRQKVGMVFQYPEHQLFESTVIEDVKFGPKNQGLDDKHASRRAYEALEMLNFPRDLTNQSPFDLSGGQKRLAAIAGVLAMQPEFIILDEPTAGLDPVGSKRILDTLKEIHSNTNKTILLVSHDMEDVANYCDRVLVMSDGHIVMDGSKTDIFYRIEDIERVGLSAPESVYLAKKLENLGFDIHSKPLSEDEMVDVILKGLR